MRQGTQLERPRHELRKHTPSLRRFIPRVQRRELDRNRGLREHRYAGLVRGADGGNRRSVSRVIRLRIGRGKRGFAEHIVRIAKAGATRCTTALERFLDRPAHHELLGHQLHRLAQRDAHDRLAGAGDHAFVPRCRIARGFGVELRQLAREHESPRRCVDQHRWALPEVFVPIAA